MQQSTQQAYLIIQVENRWTEVFRLTEGQPVVIGRASDNGIVVKEEAVSRQHTRVYPQEGGWFVEDLSSRNGTLIKKKRIEGPQQLSDGDRIQVGSCLILFSHSLQGFGSPASLPSLAASSGSQQTVELGGPTIVDRRANSRWSIPSLGSPQTEREPDSRGNWSFFYGLIFDLVACTHREAAAQVALEKLLDRIGAGSGGVIGFQAAASNAAPKAKGQEAILDPNMEMTVLATRQPPGGSYRRVSDFLVESVLTDRQSVLARNVMGDSKLSFARQSAQRETVSIICAPIFADVAQRQAVSGLLHVYTSGDQRMLSDADLELVVGVADNLSIALAKQRQHDALAQTLENTRRQINELHQQLEIASEMVGSSPPLGAVKNAIQKAAPTTATVLIRGESGVGKELVARAIHLASGRRDSPLVCLNCAALAPSLLESELFGHEKGAFTGATDRKIGKFEAASGGTLFLDEIGEMPPELQAKFLRVLEGQPFERLGGNKPITTDVRVIAATNRDLETAIAAKEFRSDLYFRLRVIEIEIPALRQRVEDIPLLVGHFIQQLSQHTGGRKVDGIQPAALEALTRHSWPGNVRELRNVIERAMVLGSGATIRVDDLSISTVGADAEQLAVPAQAGGTANRGTQTGDAAEGVGGFRAQTIAELEKEHIHAMLKFTSGNKSKAAQMLGIERSTLDRKLKRFAANEAGS